MKKHLLIAKSRVYPEPDTTPTPVNCTYNSERGYWIENDSGIAMIRSNDPQKPQSKKCDRETGEDQKGE